jgi:hypothetical protein
MSSEFLLKPQESAIQNRFAETCQVRIKQGKGRRDGLNQRSFLTPKNDCEPVGWGSSGVAQT